MKTKLLRTAVLTAIAVMGIEVNIFANESVPLATPGHAGMPMDHGSVDRMDGMKGSAADSQTAGPSRYGKGPTRGGRRGGGCGC